MKRNFTKKFLTVLLCFMTVLGMMFLVSCGDKTGGDVNDSGGSSNESGSGSTGGGTTVDEVVLPENLKLDDSKSVIKSERPNTDASPIITDFSKLFWEENKDELNPEYDSRTESLDNIFNPDALGQMVLVFDRSEWDKHLSYCDLNMNHEESVVAKGFYFTKDNKEWYFNDIGFRIRGNTSRRRPQLGNGKGNNDYVQAHFALDFEEWIPKGEDKKLADCMKGVILKRFKHDSTYSREVFAYNLFRQNGIWIAPRAAYTRLIIQIQESDGTFETVDYGVYSMIEEIKKQFLKERTTETGGYLSSNKGNLWKCLYKVSSGSDFVYNNANSIGEEKIEAIKDDSGNITRFSVQNFDYDYKDDNNFEKDGKPQLLSFMQELNNLPDCTDGKNDVADKEKITKFYNEKMAGDLFLRTYAINVILGMWDDYWVNKNNFYFYFDTDGKAYFIPYDYDNCLGTNGCGVDAGTQNPLVWGSLTNGSRPLIQKILQVPEFMDLYKKYLDEYSNEDSFFDDDKSIAQIKKWHEMIKDFIKGSEDLLLFPIDNGHYDTTPYIADEPAYWSGPYKPYTIYTPGELNFFTVRQAAIKNARISSDNLLTLDAGKGYFYMGEGKEPVKNLYYTFTTGDKLGEIFERNGFQYWCVWNSPDGTFRYGYEEDGSYFYPDWFIDESGNYVWDDTRIYKSTKLTATYCKYYTVTFNCNGGTYDGKTSINQMVPENFAISDYDFTPEKDGVYFYGWSTSTSEYIELTYMPSNDVTLYAYWVDSVVLPYEFNGDGTITFTYNPEHFDSNVVGSYSENAEVYLMFPGSNWQANEYYKLTRQNNGIYAKTFNWGEDIKPGFDSWNGYKFLIKEDVNEKWLGADVYTFELPDIYAEPDGDRNFRLVY